MTELLHNRFRLVKKRGSGGTGDVFEAEDTLLKRMVALKRPHGKTEPERHRRAARLVKEAERLAQLRHPNIVGIHDCIVTDRSVTLVLELVEGAPYHEVFEKRGVPEEDFYPLLEQLISALETVHAAGLIHRDINPKNILLTREGLLKLTDFGLAASMGRAPARAGGTLGYMAPEALRKGEALGAGADIYSLGFLSYQTLLGDAEFQRLYGTRKPVEWARWVLSREPFRSLAQLGAPVSGGLSALVEKMLAKDPRERYARMGDVRKDLELLLRMRRTAEREAPPAGGPSLAAGVLRLLPSLRKRPESSS